uniref:Uncharacterized protein n=1 Tax=Solanum lycopersicum TaxID=4081 RepID=K4C8K7_SOLLC
MLDTEMMEWRIIGQLLDGVCNHAFHLHCMLK